MLKPKVLEWIWTKVTAPVSPKNLRLSAILIAIYQVVRTYLFKLIAHIAFFIMLLGLAHAEQVKAMLKFDIADQVECESYELAPNSMNEVRLKTASELVSITELMLCLSTVIAFIYLLSCLSLFVGVYKNRSEPIVPWLIVDWIVNIIILVNMRTYNRKLIYFLGGTAQYWMLCIAFTLFNIIILYIVFAFYKSVRQMRKLTEVATVAIPCPPPGTIPFHFRKENMYLGSSGYKHVLTDCDPNQKV